MPETRPIIPADLFDGKIHGGENPHETEYMSLPEAISAYEKLVGELKRAESGPSDDDRIHRLLAIYAERIAELSHPAED